MNRSLVTLMLICSATVFVGCGRQTHEYGKSSGMSGRSSMNGFGSLRRTYENAGYSTRDVHRLTDRVGRQRVIVWTPQMPNGIAPDVTRWFDRWLKRGGRTLVYIAPDSGSEMQYWEDARELAPAEQRLEYRRRLAKSRSQRLRWSVNRRAIPSNGWFVLQPLTTLSDPKALTGQWDVMDADVGDVPLVTEYYIEPFDSSQMGTSGGASGGGTGPGAPNYVYYPPTEASKTPVNVQPLLTTKSGKPIVAEINSRRWKDSKVIVVSSGSLLTNYAFTRQFGVRLAQELVSASSPAGTTTLASNASAGFLTSHMMPIPISERQPGVPKASGMELLTVWPISLVTIHAALLGLVVCVILVPIFGRPRKVDRGTHSSFGDHLDAVAALMNRAGGDAFARSRISDYFKRMHGETSGPWILPGTSTVEVLPPVTDASQSGPIAVSESGQSDQVAGQSDVFARETDLFTPEPQHSTATEDVFADTELADMARQLDASLVRQGNSQSGEANSQSVGGMETGSGPLGSSHDDSVFPLDDSDVLSDVSQPNRPTDSSESSQNDEEQR